MGESKSSGSTSGVSVLGVVQIVFLILKLCNVDPIGGWPWWQVMLPLEISTGCMCCLCGCYISLVCCLKDDTVSTPGTELSIEYSPYESGLDRFIHPNKGNFIGLDALNKWREKGFNNKLVTLEVHDITDADVLGNNPIYENGTCIGRATGGDFGFRLGKSIALGMVKPELANVGQKLKIDILGKTHEATILEESPYDPKNELLRA